MQPRETYATALFERLKTLQDTGAVVVCDRRVRQIDDCNDADLPALFVCGDDEDTAQADGAPPIHTLGAQVYLFAANPDPNTSAEIALNGLIDAVEQALAPDSWATGTCTLGGLVQHCRIEGKSRKYVSVLGTRAAAILPLKMLVP